MTSVKDLGLGRRRLVLGAGAALARPPVDGVRRIRPPSADRFVESVGVCVHLAGRQYGRKFNEVLQAARALGARHWRDELRPSDDLDRWRLLAREAGIRAHLLVSPATNTVRDMVDTINALGPGLVSAIEGQNEGDSGWFRSQAVARPNWAKIVVEYQREAFTELRSRWSAAELPMVSPTVLDYLPEDVLYLRASAPFCDLVGLHAYVQRQQEPETGEPYAALDWYCREMRDAYKPGAPVMVTEAGYFTSSSGVSPRAAAIYLPRLLLHAFSQGVVRTFLYELLDEGADGADPQQNYGLLGADGAPKPAFHTVQTLLSILSDPGAADFTPEPIKMDVRGGPPDLRWLAFAKRNGNLDVALWRAARSWDADSRRDLPVAPAPVSLALALARRPSSVAARRVWPGSEWTELDGLGEVTVAVDDIVTMVRIAT